VCYGSSRTIPSACNNLRQAAAAAGIDPGRLVFAARVESAEHLARHRLADIVLDTLPYNAHTTASDALWMGVPVVTCLGEAFAGRVAASLLHAVGLPELVTQSLNDYEALALRLAQNPSALLELRQKLEQNHLTHPLFDTNLFRRHFESALTTMCEISRRGEASRSFRVSPDS
jgi:predicted O-linked N-acetylglucosamine transferase (SPINDLY family)